MKFKHYSINKRRDPRLDTVTAFQREKDKRKSKLNIIRKIKQISDKRRSDYVS